jgi:hypothetical protein
VGKVELSRVAKAAERATDAREAFELAIVRAVESGESLRRVGKAAGLSGERVRQLVEARS